MTTIAYRDGVLAADSGIQGNGLRIGNVQKVFKAKDGTLLGFSGNANLGADIQRWVDEGLPKDRVPDTEERGNIMMIKPDGSIWLIDGGGVPYAVQTPFTAEGSGREVAMGAMGFGASAVQAVEIALHFDSGSSGPVQYVELGNVIKLQPKEKK